MLLGAAYGSPSATYLSPSPQPSVAKPPHFLRFGHQPYPAATHASHVLSLAKVALMSMPPSDTGGGAGGVFFAGHQAATTDNGSSSPSRLSFMAAVAAKR